MAIEKKPHRRLCRRPRYVQVPIGVTFRQQHLQRTMLFAFRSVKVAAMKKQMKLLKNSYEEERVELIEMEERLTQLRAERLHALEESAWTQVCFNIVGAFAAQDIADQLRDPFSGH